MQAGEKRPIAPPTLARAAAAAVAARVWCAEENGVVGKCRKRGWRHPAAAGAGATAVAAAAADRIGEGERKRVSKGQG